MKTLLVSLLLICIAIATAFFVHKDPGQVDISFLGVDYSLSLGLTLAGIGIAFLVFYGILRAFFSLANAPRSMRERNARRHLEKSHEAIGRGLVEYSEGNFEKAESTLTKYTAPGLSCEAATLITAAKVASDRNEYDASDTYLRRAAECSPDTALAVHITEAELLLQRKEYREATKKLSAIHSNNPKNKRAIYLLVKAYENTQNWENMSNLLKEARKKQVCVKNELLLLEQKAAVGSLKEAPADNAQSIYKNLPSHIQDRSEVVYAYAQNLCDIGKEDIASSLVAKSLNTNWNEKLAELYGTIYSTDITSQIQQAAKWKNDNGASSALLLSLGSLNYRNNKWTEAKDFVVSSIEIKPSMSAFFLLGKILEAVDDPVAALEAYKHGYATDGHKSTNIAINSEDESINRVAEPA